MSDLISRQTEADALKKCMTCKHDPPKMDKWPCVDCDMRDPADRWEAQDVPDIKSRRKSYADSR